MFAPVIFPSSPWVYNILSGGTVTTFTDSGLTYRRHLFTTIGAGTLTVQRNPNPFRITMIAGGGESGYNDPDAGEGTPGGSGGGKFLESALPVGDIAFQVGRQAAGAYINVAANDTTLDGIGTVGGGGHGKRMWNGTGRTNGRTGTWGGASNGGNGGNTSAYDTPNDPSAALRTLLGGVTGLWGKYGAGRPAPHESIGGMNAGQNGMLCIEYVVSP